MESNSRNIYKTARTVAGLTQERWAEAVGVSVESIRNYEAGTQLPGDSVVKIMSEISGLSPLSYWHLCNKSELAAETLPEIDVVPLPQAVCGLVSLMESFVCDCPAQLLRMAADGKIDQMEQSAYSQILFELDRIIQAALQLKYSERGSMNAKAEKARRPI